MPSLVSSDWIYELVLGVSSPISGIWWMSRRHATSCSLSAVASSKKLMDVGIGASLSAWAVASGKLKF